MKSNRIIFILLICLFAIIPFFWLKPDHINIGGDSSGAYFYDPFTFIKNYAVYSINPWNVNSEITGYFLIPFSFMLYLLLILVKNPHNLINLFDSLTLVVSFTSMYGSIYELLTSAGKLIQKGYARTAAIIGGLFYIFSPNMTNWDKPLITFTHFMLDPLMFYLIFRYLRTKNIWYGFIILFISFIFAHNFSFIGAPTFFSFYPFIFLYFIFAHFFIRRFPLNFKHIILLFLIFIGLQSFQIFPQLILMFSPHSVLADRVFSQSIFNYVDYFYKVVNGVVVIDNFLSVSKSVFPFASTFFIFPFLIIFSLFQKVKSEQDYLIKKSYLFFLFLFLILLFFTSAKFTQVGIGFYALLFRIPGFGMFRHFTGQFMTSYIFFYSVVIGFAYYTLATKLNNKILYILTITTLFILFLRGWPLLNGSMLYLPVLQSKIATPFKMPKGFVDAISYISHLKTDSKLLAFPLNDYGYLLFAGEQDGLYIGTSLLGPLTLKPEFQSPEDLGPFAKQFRQAAYLNDKQLINNVLAYMDIHDIFWEKNPKIYSAYLPDFPYSTTKLYIPNTVSAYNLFTENLPITNTRLFGKSIQVMHLDPKETLPTIYVSGKPVYTNNIFDTVNIPFKNLGQPSVVLQSDAYLKNITYRSFIADYSNQFIDLNDNLQFHNAQPEVSWKPGNLIYPFVLKKENFTLSRLYNRDKIDISYLFLTKRIEELGKWGNKMPIYKSNRLFFWENFNSWESIFEQYRNEAEKLISYIDNYSPKDKNAQKLIAEEQFEQHRLRADVFIKGTDYSPQEKKILQHMNMVHFNNLIKSLRIDKIEPVKNYSLTLPNDAGGLYSIILSRTKWSLSNYKIKVNDQELNGNLLSDGEVSFGNVRLKSGNQYKIILNYEPTNLSLKFPWEGYENLSSSMNIDHITFSLIDNLAYKPVVRRLPILNNATQYILTFEYNTNNEPFSIRLFNNSVNNQGNLENNDFSKRIIQSDDWKLYQSVFTVGPQTKSAGIEINSSPLNGRDRLEIKNFKFTAVEHPLLTFWDTNTNSNTLPKIFFQRINPTKYKIKVTGANEPYILTFLKAYNVKWKLYYTGKNNINNRMIDETYFDGLISEGDHKNILLDRNTFETWKMPEIASNNHLLANGYANAWLINPDKTYGANYELILEFTGQRQFYIGSLITVITVIIILVILLFIIINMMINLKR